ncbi:hypothetical protein [uncultured Thiohalocapsa sp.]|uniref:hypothetical protein n=1 Tax=uncultured Thiohalocapsa sp. TaxID=768990 RepID=UPI0025F5B5B4|nr:hypothetical protein [uncultured Thiohalocapsa sp.]
MQAHQHNGAALSQRRRAAERQWQAFMEAPGRQARPGRAAVAPATAVAPDILSSWRRSARYLTGNPPRAPVEDAALARELWQSSPLRHALEVQRPQLEALAREGSLLAAVAGPCGRLLWTYASGHMLKPAAAVNFVHGGRWDEAAVGTNAVGLGLRLRRPVTVFSSEHFQPFVHDWVCYAAPILHPRTGACLGLLDLSTTWDRHTPLGQAAVSDLARSIAQALPPEAPRAELEVRALGQPRVQYQGRPLALPPRQVEILCLLTLHPEGLGLEALHAALYGDAQVSRSTLKAELSQLRAALDGQIGSRPYRLTLPVWADFIEIWQALHRGQAAEAIGLYGGPLLAASASPALEEWRHCIDAVMARALEACDEPAGLIGRICRSTAGSEMLRERLAELMDA